MNREILIAVAICMAFLAMNVQALNIEQVSPISEKSRTSWNQTFTLDEAHKKCAEYLRTTLAQFLQKVNKTANNDGTANLGQKVEDELNKKVHALMGKCDPTTLGVAQFVSTKVDPKEKGLRVEQLVIQKIQLTPNLRKVGDTGNKPMNCTNSSAAKPAMAMRTLSSKECAESQEALVAEWENQKYELEEQAILIEKLQAELAALKLNFSTVHKADENKIVDEKSEIDKLKKSLAEKDVELARVKSEKMTADQNNLKLTTEKIECDGQVKNLKDQVQALEIGATKMIDKTLCEQQKTQLEQRLTVKCNEEKNNLSAIATECANKVEQLKNEVSLLITQKEAESKRCKEDTEQQKKLLEQNLTIKCNEEKNILTAGATECAHKVDQLKNDISLLITQKEAESKRCKEDTEEQKKLLEQNLTLKCNEEKNILTAGATECANKVEKLKNEMSVLSNQKEAEIKKCKDDAEEQKKQMEQNLTSKCNEEKNILTAGATESANKVEKLKNEMSVLSNQKEAEIKKCKDDAEEQKKQMEQNLTSKFNEEKKIFAASAAECANKVEQLKNEMSLLVTQKEIENKQCKEEMERQKKLQEQNLTMIFNEERIIFVANAAECTNKLEQLKNETSILSNQKQIEGKQCEEQIKTLTNAVSSSVNIAIHEDLKRQCELQINEKKKCEEEKASQKIVIDNLTLEKQQVKDALASCQSTNQQTISNLQASIENEKTAAISIAAQLQQCNQKMVDCTAVVSQKELESTKKESELQDEKKKCDDKTTKLETNIQQINVQHANELKVCQDGIVASKSETSKLEAVTTEINLQIQACTNEKSKLASELVSANNALKTLNESATSITVMKDQYEKIAHSCNQDTAALIRAISRRNQKFIAYWKLIESDSFMSIAGLSGKAQNELNITMQLQLDTNPLQCNQTITWLASSK